jgi:phosphinothricin acetyltransferase
VIVAEAEGRVIGWGSLNSFNPRPVYDHVADFSIYVERGWRGRGVGRALLDCLIERARALGYHKLVLAAFPSNQAGMRLYERAGFRKVGVYEEQGRLDGRWVDVVIMERLL